MYKLHKAVCYGASHYKIEESIVCESDCLDDLYTAFDADLEQYIDKHNEIAEYEFDRSRYWKEPYSFDPDNIDRWVCEDMLDTIGIGELEYLWEKH